MNMNMNNTSSILELVNKIPVGLYFSELPDRQQALKYLDYLYANIPASRAVDSDKLFREVIARELRGVSMKIIEPEILLLVALDKISLADFTSPSGDLVRKVIAQNADKFDLDIMQRIMAQIMTKLPRDLRDRVAGKHKLQVFQLIARQLNMNPQLLERFASLDPSLNTASVSMELDAGDYNTLNKKYLQELYNYQKRQPYISANSLEYGSLAAEMALSQATTPNAHTNGGVGADANANLKAQYIDQSPSLMVGAKDNTLYYFDPSSGTLSEMPTSENQTPVSIQDLKTILASRKINQGEIQDAINAIHSTTPATTMPVADTTIPDAFFAWLEKAFTGLITGSTQAQATLQTVANIAPTEPVPPAFLTKLYNLKHARTQQSTGGNYSDAQSDNYMRMISGLGGSNISAMGGYQRPGNQSSSQVASYPGGMFSSQPNYMPNSSIGAGGYTQNDALPVFNVTNPQTTYAAFSGPAPNETTTTSAATTTTSQATTTTSQATTTTAPSTTQPTPIPTFADGRAMTADEIKMENAYQYLESTYSSRPNVTRGITTTTTGNTTTTTGNPTTTAKSGFANLSLGPNSQVVATEHTVATKIKNDTKNVEKIAIGFITILILIFLIAVIAYVKNAKSSS